MHLKISHKLIAAVGLTVISIIGIFSYIMIHSQSEMLIEELERSALQLIESVKSSTKYDMLMGRNDAVHRILDAVAKTEGIERVRIFDKQGRVVFSSEEEEIDQKVDVQAEACYICHMTETPLETLPQSARTRTFRSEDGYRVMGVTDPVMNEPSCWQGSCHIHPQDEVKLGTLDIMMSLKEVDEQLVASQWRMLTFAVVTILAISLCLGFMLRRIVITPVNKLVEAHNQLAGGNLNYTLDTSKSDEIGYLAKSFNDMTRKLGEAQRQIYHSDKLASLGRMAAGVAHEINNPLTGILTYASYLHKRLNSDPDVKADLEVIVRETKRSRQIVQGLLNFSRQTKPSKTLVDLEEVLNKAATILSNELRSHNVTLKTELPELPQLRADANQLEQLFINLIVNAIDAIGESGGEITVTGQLLTDDETQTIELEFSDTGCGIPFENQDKIFDPFFSTKGFKGTGLGLSVVWGIVQKHGGTIEVESEPGDGATFRIRFPLDGKEKMKVEN